MPGPNVSYFSALEELESAPINPAWILEGTPSARNRVIAPSTDRFGWTMLWDCTAGKFNWHYTIDETVHVIEGGVIVTGEDGVSKTLRIGDIAFFPAGSTAHWHVENYVRKVAYCQKPAPAIIAFPLRVLRKMLLQFIKAIRLIETSLADPRLPAPAAPEALPQPVANFKQRDIRLIGSRLPGA